MPNFLALALCWQCGRGAGTGPSRLLADPYSGVLDRVAPQVVTDYPAACKPFYMRQNDDQRTAAAMDVVRCSELCASQLCASQLCSRAHPRVRTLAVRTLAQRGASPKG